MTIARIALLLLFALVWPSVVVLCIVFLQRGTIWLVDRMRARYRRQHRVTLYLTLPCPCCGVVAVPATVTLAPGERVDGVLVCSLCGGSSSFNADAEVGS